MNLKPTQLDAYISDYQDWSRDTPENLLLEKARFKYINKPPRLSEKERLKFLKRKYFAGDNPQEWKRMLFEKVNGDMLQALQLPGAPMNLITLIGSTNALSINGKVVGLTAYRYFLIDLNTKEFTYGTKEWLYANYPMNRLEFERATEGDYTIKVKVGYNECIVVPINEVNAFTDMLLHCTKNYTYLQPSELSIIPQSVGVTPQAPSAPILPQLNVEIPEGFFDPEIRAEQLTEAVEYLETDTNVKSDLKFPTPSTSPRTQESIEKTKQFIDYVDKTAKNPLERVVLDGDDDDNLSKFAVGYVSDITQDQLFRLMKYIGFGKAIEEISFTLFEMAKQIEEANVNEEIENAENVESKLKQLILSASSKLTEFMTQLVSVTKSGAMTAKEIWFKHAGTINFLYILYLLITDPIGNIAKVMQPVALMFVDNAFMKTFGEKSKTAVLSMYTAYGINEVLGPFIEGSTIMSIIIELGKYLWGMTESVAYEYGGMGGKALSLGMATARVSANAVALSANAVAQVPAIAQQAFSTLGQVAVGASGLALSLPVEIFKKGWYVNQIVLTAIVQAMNSMASATVTGLATAADTVITMMNNFKDVFGTVEETKKTMSTLQVAIYKIAEVNYPLDTIPEKSNILDGIQSILDLAQNIIKATPVQLAFGTYAAKVVIDQVRGIFNLVLSTVSHQFTLAFKPKTIGMSAKFVKQSTIEKEFEEKLFYYLKLAKIPQTRQFDVMQAFWAYDLPPNVTKVTDTEIVNIISQLLVNEKASVKDIVRMFERSIK